MKDSLLLKILYLLVFILVKIGDGILCFFSLIKNLKIKIKPKARKIRVRRPQLKIIYPLPLAFKLKYFLIGVVFSFIFLFSPLLTLIFLQELPNPRELSKIPLPQTTKIYDRNGTLLYEIYANQNRSLVPLLEIPQSLIKATIAIEDKDFYKHPGFDLVAILRALKKTLVDKQPQGGSTITQQLIRSSFLESDPSITRKVKEIVLAFWTERIYSKDQILEMYLNHVPYGGVAWGVEAAAQTYFGKNVKDLTLPESALLAGLPAAPSIYSPFGSQPEYARQRQIEVLNRMEVLGFIKEEELKKAQEEELVFKKPVTPIKAPHFVLYVKDLLAQKYGLGLVEQGGLKVITTLDLPTQKMVENIVREEVEKLASLNVTNGAGLVSNPQKGDILAMVGSRDYFSSGGNFNVTLALRQPGSAIKVVNYAAALENGFTAANILEDTPATFSSQGSFSYSPVNYDGRFHGRVSLRAALANSYNVPAVKTLNQIGVERMVAMGKRLGIKSWEDSKNFGLSLTLGGGEVTMLDLATVYGVLANQGMRADVNPILKVTDSKGEVLEEKKINSRLVLNSGIAFIISDILADNNARAATFGTNSVLNIPGSWVSVKTGTSDNKRDNWTIGYARDFMTTVWVGNNNNSPMHPSLVSGITGAAPIWNKIMAALLSGKNEEKPIPPENVIASPCLGRIEYFIKGTEKNINCRPVPMPTPTP